MSHRRLTISEILRSSLSAHINTARSTEVFTTKVRVQELEDKMIVNDGDNIATGISILELLTVKKKTTSLKQDNRSFECATKCYNIIYSVATADLDSVN